MARTFYKTADGRFTPAKEVRGDKTGKKANMGFGLRFGTTSKNPNGKLSAAQAEKVIKNGMIIVHDVKGVRTVSQVTKENRTKLINQLTANEVRPESKVKAFLTNAGREAGQKSARPTLHVHRGTSDNPKVTTRGSGRGQSPIIKAPLSPTVKAPAGSKETTSSKNIKLSGGNSASKGGSKKGGRGKK